MSLVIEVEKRVRLHEGFKALKRKRFFSEISAKKWKFNRPAKIDWIINRKYYIYEYI